MSSEKRLVLFLVLSMALMFGTKELMDRFGLTPPPPPARDFDPAVAKPGDPKAANPAVVAAAPEVKVTVAEQAAPKPGNPPPLAVVPPNELVLGSTADGSDAGYRMELRLEQAGAGVATLASSRYDAELVDGQKARRPLRLIQPNPKSPPSFALNLAKAKAETGVGTDEPAATPPGPAAAPGLDSRTWEVVRDDKGRAVRPISKPDPATKKAVEGQELVFRSPPGEPGGLVITKRFRLYKGQDGFEFEIGLESPDGERTVAYELLGPHGIPIEGEWYTGTFRDVFFGQDNAVVTRSASDVYKARDEPERFQTLPIRYAGVENQYFAVLVAPQTSEVRINRETSAKVIQVDALHPEKADVAVEFLSRPEPVGPNRPATHAYRVYAGPKTVEGLEPFGADELASYRKNQWFNIPGGAAVAKYVIDPLLKRVYALTAQVSRLFGGKRGNYGIAIILLTMTVKLILFPLGRKTAASAKKMQDLQPLIAVLKEKYGDDKERITKETLALYKQYGVNPAGGCLPALVQLPVFVGLWQALNNSVSLRHAPFLYIQNLAAPDMLFRFPVEIPYLGNYFNLLPFLVVSLQLVQTRLFAPPALTEEAKMQQSMMKYLMFFMAFMFYKVPSGLGLYFITSSLWAIGERLLVPKLEARKKANAPAIVPGADLPNGGPPPRPANGWRDKLERKLNAIMEEAAHDKTIRNNANPPGTSNNGGGNGRDPDKGRPRPKSGGGGKRR